MTAKNGILLVNLGTPDSPSVKDVRKYLAEFLLDARVIDMRTLWRKLLVRGLIVPFSRTQVSCFIPGGMGRAKRFAAAPLQPSATTAITAGIGRTIYG